MKYTLLVTKISLVLVLCCLIFPKKSYAYLDPGIGSFFIQIAIGFLVGAVFAIKLYWRKTKDWFNKLLFNKHENQGD